MCHVAPPWRLVMAAGGGGGGPGGAPIDTVTGPGLVQLPLEVGLQLAPMATAERASELALAWSGLAYASFINNLTQGRVACWQA